MAEDQTGTRKKATRKKKAGASRSAPPGGVREPGNKQPGSESRTDKQAGDELDSESLHGLEQIEAEGQKDEQRERGADLADVPDYPYDRRLAEALEIIDRGLFTVAAGRGGRHWMLTEAEAAELSKCQAQCIERYIGSVQFGPAVSLVFCTAGIVGPRLAETARLKAEFARRAREPDPSAGAGPDPEDGSVAH